MRRVLEWFRDTGLDHLGALFIVLGAVFAPVGLLSFDLAALGIGAWFLAFGLIGCPWMKYSLQRATGKRGDK